MKKKIKGLALIWDYEVIAIGHPKDKTLKETREEIECLKRITDEEGKVAPCEILLILPKSKKHRVR